jgi:integrase
MDKNLETDISKVVGSAWVKKFSCFLTDLEPLGPATVRKYVAVVRALLGNDFLFTLDRANRFIKQKNRVYIRAAVVSFIKFLEHEQVLSELESTLWTKKTAVVKEPPPRPKEIPSPQEIMRVIDHMEKDDARIAKFMFYTGARISEALGVKLKDINFNTGVITLYGKGRLQKKPRSSKIPMELAGILQKEAKDLGLLDGEFIFWPNSKAGIDSKVIMFNERFRKACIDILGKSIGSHDFRRIVATTLLKETGDLQLVQQILGHEKIETTQRYTKYVDKERYMDQAREIMKKASGG